jgi:hypothetical protein
MSRGDRLNVICEYLITEWHLLKKQSVFRELRVSPLSKIAAIIASEYVKEK